MSSDFIVLSHREPYEEVETDNWGVGGESVTARNAKAP